MSNQLQITGGAKVRNLQGVITGTSGVLSSVPLGAANGVATLDSSGKVPVSQLPSSVVTYLGTWNAATNTPTLTNGTGDAGDLYICNVAGTANFGAGPITFAVGDWVIYGSGTWQKSSGQNGTVTSVAASITGNAIGITGSPITTAGTLAFSFAGTSGQYINGAGNLVTFPSLTGYVPYTGANSSVNLGIYSLSGSELYSEGTGSGAGFLYLKQNTTISQYLADYSAIGGYSNGYVFNIATPSVSKQALLDLSLISANATRTYKLPDASGTVALTSDLSSYVTLGTSQTITGAKTFSATTLLNTIYVDGVSYLKHQSTTSYISGYTTFSAKTSGVIEYFFPTSYKSVLDFNDTADYTYTFPDASGTIAILEAGTQTFTGTINVLGSLGTKYGISIEKGNTPSPFSLNDIFIYAASGATNSLKVQNSAYSSTLNFPTSNQTFTFPSSSGTIALTSDLSSYVTLGTSQTISGSKIFSNDITFSGVTFGTNGYYSGTVQPTNGIVLPQSGSRVTGSGLTTISVSGTNGIAVGFPSGQLSSLAFPTASSNTYTFPAASGTIALTSNLSSYLPLTGGTLTGALSGTSAIFSGAVQTSRIKLIEPTYSTNYTIYTGVDNSNSIGIYNETSNVYNLKIAPTGAATFSSSVTAVQGYFTNSSGDTITLSKGSGPSIQFAKTDVTAQSWALTGEGTAFKLYNYTAGTTPFLVTSSGNVGIGTTNPNAPLHLYKSSGNVVMTLQTGTAYGYVYNDGTNVVLGSDVGSTGAKFLVNRNAPDNAMSITSGGNLLIGTTSDNGYRLRINGGGIWVDNGIIYANGASAALSTQNREGSNLFIWIGYNAGMRLYNDALGFIGTFAATTGVYTANSDIRLKENILDSVSALSTLSKLKVKSYNWKHNGLHESFGLIAQDVYDVLPEYVFKPEDENDNWGISKGELVPMLVKAIQEQSEIINKLEARIVSLESK